MALLLLTSSNAFATEDTLRKISPYEFFDLVEDLYSTPEQAEEALDFLDVLTFGRDITLEEIMELPGISSSTALRIGRSDTVNWSRLSSTLSSRESRLLSPLLYRAPKYLWSSRSRVQLDPLADQEKGHNNGQTLGDSYRIYDRLMLSQYGLRAGLLQAKDAGEARTLDHLRGFLQLHEPQSILGDFALENVIAGDYSLSFGSGLLFSSGGMQGKSNEVIDAVEANAKGIAGYLSSSVGSGFRGGAARFALGPMATTFFYSNRAYDASVTDDTIKSIDIDGYHRTGNDMTKIDAARTRLLGADLSYNTTGSSYRLQIGATAFNEAFALPVQTGGFEHNFSGKGLSMLSQHGAYADTTIGINYEIAMSKQEKADALGATVGVVYEASRKWQFALNGRYLPHDFVSRHGSAFGESTDDAQNERGAYFAVRYLPVKALKLSAYVDLSSTFTPPYLASNNFRATDLLLLAEYDVSGNMSSTWRSRFKRKSDEERMGESRVLGSRDQINSRLEHDWTPSPEVRLRTTGEIVRVSYNNFNNEEAETGFVISSSLKLSPAPYLNLELRSSWFNTPSYDSRLYVYENDLPGASGLTLLYGAGMRYAILLATEATDGVSIAVKYGITVYSREREFGSGITERTGKTSSKIGFQLDLQF